MDPRVSKASLIIRDWVVDVEGSEPRLYFFSRSPPSLASSMLV